MALVAIFTLDQKLLIGGYTVSPTTFENKFMLTRFNTDGTVDTSFGTNGFVTTSIGEGLTRITALTLDNDGKIVAVGKTKSGDKTLIAISRYDSSGNLDTDFDSDGILITSISSYNDEPIGVIIDSNNYIIIGAENSDGTNTNYALIRLLPSGILDGTFGTSGKAITNIGALLNTSKSDDKPKIVLRDSSDRILMGGTSLIDNAYVLSSVRFSENGNLDTFYGSKGAQTINVSGYNSFGINGVLYQDYFFVIGYIISTYEKDAVIGRFQSFSDSSFKIQTDIDSTSEEHRAAVFDSSAKLVICGTMQDGIERNAYVIRYLGLK